MASLKMGLDKRRIKNDGTYPLVFFINLKRKQKLIKTGISLKPQQYDGNNKEIKENPSLNLMLKELEARYIQRFYSYQIKYPTPIGLEHLYSYIIDKPLDKVTIADFWKKHIASLEIEKRFGHAKIFQQSFNTISSETDLNISFQSFNHSCLLKLESNLYKRGMSTNGIGVYLRSLRVICNKAVENEIVPPSWYPFSNFKIKKQSTTPRVLTLNEMKDFFKLDLHPTSSLYKYWNIGKLLFMLRGINITDLLLLTPKNIIDTRLVYRRSKTKKIYSVLICSEIKDVLDTFNSNETLIGILSKKELGKKNKTEIIHQKRKIINKYLKKIGIMIKSNEPITSYVFRYSYANIAKQLGFSKDLIAEALGHEYGNAVTGIYLEPFDLDQVDEMSFTLINFIQ